MKKNGICFFASIFLLSLLLSAYAHSFDTSDTDNGKTGDSRAAKRSAYVPTEQEKGALKVFNEILDLIESTSDRKSILPQLEEMYDRIITQYPEAPLAQESYWKLMTLYMEDYSPPAYDRAEVRYHEFMAKYPKSILMHFLVEVLGRSYYRDGMWDKLLEICTPVFREYIDNGKKTRASLLFMYAEANYNLGNKEEAVKGYEIVAEKFPRLNEGKKSMFRLEEIRKEAE